MNKRKRYEIKAKFEFREREAQKAQLRRIIREEIERVILSDNRLDKVNRI